jgi:hypothetical protein
LRIVQVDAFTARPFAGNPAAVCVLPAPVPPARMQAIANEMNLAETAFLVRHGDAFDLRWFTPSTEVDLCGHATLASAHVLWEDGHLAPGAEARFDTRSGRLTARRFGEWIEMDFPAEPPHADPAPPGLIEALGVTPAWTGHSSRLDYRLIEVADEDAVRSVAPDFHALQRVARGIIVTAQSESSQADFVSRFFAPRSAWTGTGLGSALRARPWASASRPDTGYPSVGARRRGAGANRRARDPRRPGVTVTGVGVVVGIPVLSACLLTIACRRAGGSAGKFTFRPTACHRRVPLCSRTPTGRRCSSRCTWRTPSAGIVMREPGRAGRRILAHFDWATFSADTLASWYPFPDGPSQPLVTTRITADGRFVAELDGQADTIDIPRFPAHIHDAGFATLAPLFAHLRDPEGAFTIGVFHPVPDGRSALIRRRGDQFGAGACHAAMCQR